MIKDGKLWCDRCNDAICDLTGKEDYGELGYYEHRNLPHGAVMCQVCHDCLVNEHNGAENWRYVSLQEEPDPCRYIKDRGRAENILGLTLAGVIFDKEVTPHSLAIRAIDAGYGEIDMWLEALEEEINDKMFYTPEIGDEDRILLESDFKLIMAKLRRVFKDVTTNGEKENGESRD